MGAVLALMSMSAPYAADKPEVRIGWVYAMANAPVIIADKKGMFASNGIDAKVTVFKPRVAQLAAGTKPT